MKVVTKNWYTLNLKVGGLMINFKNLYKYETHCHTSESSACAISTASEMVNAYYKLGYSGLVITDHFLNANTTADPSLDWEQRINIFYSGYSNALLAAKNLNFNVLFGFEYGYKGMDFLIYGLDLDFFFNYPQMLSWSPEYFFDKVHECNGFIIHAHPFRQRPYISKIRLYPDYVDAIEVFNSGNDLQEFNDLALEYAQENNLIQIRGSDSHDAKNISGEGIYFKTPISTNQELVHVLKTQEFYPLNNRSHL